MSHNCSRSSKEPTAENQPAVDTTNVCSDPFADDNLNVEHLIQNRKLAEVCRALSFQDNLGIIDSFILINCKKMPRLSFEDYGQGEELDSHQENIRDKFAKNDRQDEGPTVLTVPTKTK
eukprot:CCRYP_013636-RA/>CCRYP_013636-RA protein AED:0.43 eAED:0.43 QI:0/-1/0/1/-1/1/1/0/118